MRNPLFFIVIACLAGLGSLVQAQPPDRQTPSDSPLAPTDSAETGFTPGNVIGELEGREQIARFKISVQDVGEFIDRFNGTRDMEGQPVKALSDEDRRRQIGALLCEDIWNQAEEQELRAFVEAAFATRIAPYQPGWYAVLDCETEYRGKPQKMKLTMVKRAYGQDAVRWNVAAVKAPFLRKPEQTAETFVPPNADGTNFIALRQALEETQEAEALAAAEYDPDPLTLFFSAVNRKELSIKRVDKVTYHFLQIDGWIFKVNDFAKPSAELQTSGWLVSGIKRADLEAKNAYLAERILFETPD